MRFLKEYIVLSLIIVFLIVGDVFITKFSDKNIKEIDSKVDEIRTLILSDNEKNIKMKEIEEFSKKWKSVRDEFAYFTKHEDLEEVSALIDTMKANVELDSVESAYEKTQEIKFRIEYIKNKLEFKLNNIF